MKRHIPRQILCVVHDDGPKDDRASGFLAEAGHEIDWVCPADGEALPPVADGFDAAIVYGGVQSAKLQVTQPRGVEDFAITAIGGQDAADPQ